MPGSNMWEMEQRRFSLADNERLPPPSRGMVPSTSEDLHAWSIYRQNLNSDFTDSALGSSEKSPLPYGNFQLRESTVQSILNHPRYGPKSPLGANMYTYLKFGLPRVFPPNGKKDTSSGYNSSEEGTRPRRSSYMRPRSEADFVNLHYYHPMGGSRGKSLSQANLLSPETLLRQVEASHRRSLHDLRHADYMMHHHHPPPPPGNMIRPASVALPPNVGPLPPEPFSFSMLHPQQYTGLYPHLQVRNLNIRGSKGEPLVNNMSLEVKAGEILSIMSTSNEVNRSILDVLAGHKRYSGHITLNGQAVGSSQLRKVVAYVRSETVLPPDLPVYNCLRFYAKLKKPSRTRGKIPMGEQVRIVTEELGLSPVLSTKVAELTPSEYARLLVAIQLLSDPQVICIDHITHCMDIFDTFFLVEFLRQWASGATGGVIGRIVIISLQPPTYEILTMVSRLVILSSGETMYHGPARHLTQYFTSADYPCPAFKNPADYYLDLVTLDDLSAEAMLESSQRVDQLAALYRRRQQPLSEPQPYTLPEEFISANPISQMFSLFKRNMFYSQPSSFLKWLSRVLVAVIMSIIIGAVFWDIPNTDPFLMREDRLGYHFTVLCVASFPLVLLLGLSRVRGAKLKAARSDIRQGLYSNFLYIFTTVLFSWIPSALIWTAYLIPSYCMTGLYDPSSNSTLSINLGYMLLSLVMLETIATLMGHLFDGNLLSIVFYAFVHWTFSASTGYPVHSGDLPLLTFKYSPLATVYKEQLKRDYSNATLTALNSQLVCRNRQVQRQDIIVHQSCPIPNGAQALNYHGLIVHDVDPLYPPLATMGGASILIILTFLIMTLFRWKTR